MKFIKYFSFIFVLLCFSFNCFSANIDTEYEKAIKGNAEAQLKVGFMYFTGRGGVKQSYETAFDWYEQAAEQNNVEAQYFLGIMYHSGVGVKRNYKKAFEWNLIASKNGNIYAKANLANAYMYGLGVEKDQGKAISIYNEIEK